MVAFAPLFTLRRLGTIASIDADDRGRVLTRLLTSSNYFVRQLAMSFKAMATLLYAKSEAVRIAMTVPVARLASAMTPAEQEPPSDAKLISAMRLTSRAKALRGEKHDHAAA
jgi:hypothetical protein